MKLVTLKLANIVRYTDKSSKTAFGFIGICLFSSLLSFPTVSQSATQSGSTAKDIQRWFEVEVILYKSSSDNGLIDESWAKDTQLKLPNELIDFLQPYALPANSELLDNQVDSSVKAISPPATSNDLIPAVESDQNETPFVLLEDSLLQLKKESKNIARNRRYKLLAHFSWRQPVTNKKRAVPIRIAGGEDFQSLFEYSGEKKLIIPILETETNAVGSEIELSQTELKQASSNLESESEQQNFTKDKSENMQVEDLNLQPVALPWVPEIDGSILVYIQRNYLHLDTNLFYRRPDKEEIDIFSLGPLMSPMTDIQEENYNSGNEQLSGNTFLPANKTLPENSIGTENNDLYGSGANDFSWQYDGNFLNQETDKMYAERLFNYPLIQSRRLRSKELHYFDHPLIGMLVMIRPYEINESLSDQNDPE